jgi:hypothetical protein
LTATSLSFNNGSCTAATVTNTVNDVRSGAVFTFPARTLTTTFTKLPIALTAGQGQGGPYDFGDNIISFPSRGIYRLHVWVTGDTGFDANRIDLRWFDIPNVITYNLRDYPIGGQANVPSSTMPLVVRIDSITTRFQLEGRGSDFSVTNFSLQGSIARVCAIP